MDNSNNSDSHSGEQTIAAGKARPHKLAKSSTRRVTYLALAVASLASLILAATFRVPAMGETQVERLEPSAIFSGGAVGDLEAPIVPWDSGTALGGSDWCLTEFNIDGDISDVMEADSLSIPGLAGVGGSQSGTVGVGNVGRLRYGPGEDRVYWHRCDNGRVPGAHVAPAPVVRMGVPQVDGGLPKEVIRRLLRQQYGRFRLCYENGLARDPRLAGRVSVRFTIDRKGAVSGVTSESSSLSEPGVVRCLVRTFHGLTFPKPKVGIVTVDYAILFGPG